MAPLMNGHADLISNGKPHQLYRYYGVRKCGSLEGPAIFLNWKDCKFFLRSEKDDNVEYQTFDRIVDAVSYVTFQRVAEANDRPDITPEVGASLLTSLKRSADQASLPSSAGSPKRRLPEIPGLAHSISNETTETEPDDPYVDLLCADSADEDRVDAFTTDGLESHRVFEEHIERLKEYKKVYGTATVLLAEECCEERFMGLNRFVDECRRSARNIARGRSKQTSASYAKIRQLIDLGIDLGVDPKTICDPAPASNDGSETMSQVTGEQVKGKLSKAFERRIEQLQWYKEKYGTTVLMPEHLQGEFKRLKKFLYDWRTKRADQGKAQQSIATESRIRRLVSLGFLDEEGALGTQAATLAPATENQGAPGKKPIRARFSPAFERDFQLMKEYKDTYNTTFLTGERCQGKSKNLRTFLCHWRDVQDKQDKTQQSSATESRIRRLISLGFLCDKESIPARSSTYVPPRTSKQRTSGDPKIIRASSAFERDFQLLKEYKDTYGTTSLSAEHCQGQFLHLKRFLYYWRAERVKQLGNNTTQNLTSASESKLRRLVTLGFLDQGTVDTRRFEWASSHVTGTCVVREVSNTKGIDEIYDEGLSVKEDCDNSQPPIKSVEPRDSPIESEYVKPATLYPSVSTTSISNVSSKKTGIISSKTIGSKQ